MRIDENQSTVQHSEANEASTSAAAASRLDSDKESGDGESEVSTHRTNVSWMFRHNKMCVSFLAMHHKVLAM